jgi:GNAT superfamily N-acetyltransferase
MALTLTPAIGPLLDAILTDTFEIWNDGLDRAAYASFWRGQLKTAWGAAHLDRVALVDGSTILSSAKRYDLSARVEGRIRRVLGIGAVFTTPAERGRGAGTELLQRILDWAEAEGYEFAMLFSEIGPAYYERLDFVPVPLDTSLLTVRIGRGSPAVLVRSGDDRDIAAVSDLSATRAAGARFALERSEDFVRYGLTKRRLLAGLVPTPLRQVEFLVTEEGHTAVAYLVCSIEGRRWFVEDAGDRDPSGARVGAMLQAMLARDPSNPPIEIRSWWPLSAVPPQMIVSPAGPTNEVLMIRALQDRHLPLPPLEPSEVVYRRLDHF